MQTNGSLTLKDKQPLRANLETYFKNPENLNYRVLHIDHRDLLLTAKNEIKPSYEIPNFYSIKGLKSLKRYEKTRLKNGFWLEMAIQIAQRKAHIDFLGNSPNLEHYPHTKGLSVDIETDYNLIEATNLTKWLGFEECQEKINYFFKRDPTHLKEWVFITTFKKALPLKIRQQIANNNITVLYTEQTVTKDNYLDVANQLIKPLTKLYNTAKTIHYDRITRVRQLFFTPKNRYQNFNFNNSSIGSEIEGCVSFLYGQKPLPQG